MFTFDLMLIFKLEFRVCCAKAKKLGIKLQSEKQEHAEQPDLNFHRIKCKHTHADV